MDSIIPLIYTPVYDEEKTESLKADFSRLKGDCYLDHAGATLYSDTQVKETLEDFTRSLYANPHSVGVAGAFTEDTIDRVRCMILDYFHTTLDEYTVIFTSGATASLKTLAETFDFGGSKNEYSKSQGKLVYLQDNHTSVLGMREVALQRGAEVICMDHDEAFKILHKSDNHNLSGGEKNALFVYSAQCNFSGLKYPLDWIENIQNGNLNYIFRNENQWFVALDAASYVSSNDLDLSIYKPDFVTISFYKIFGYPTGIGALLVKNSSSYLLKKVYYGGGTVNVALSSEIFHIKRDSLHQRFEDGTVSYLSIIALQYGFKSISNLARHEVSEHVFSLARYLHHSLLTFHHSNGAPVVKLYADTDYEDLALQGGIVSFNILRANGEFVGYMEVLNMAAIYKIYLRTGCFCNPGACQRHLKLTNKQVLENYDDGYTCGGSKDLINGKPTGAVRISFGYMSTIDDVHRVILMIKKCFVNEPLITKIPDWWENKKSKFNLKYHKKNLNLKTVKNTSNEKINIRSSEDNLFEGMKKPDLQKEFNENFNNNQVKTEKDTLKCTLSRLFIYPIKSCGMYEIKDSWKVTSKGLQYDREWMIVNSAGVCLTQKNDVKLCLIKPIIDITTNQLRLHYPGMPPLEIPLVYSKDEYNIQRLCRGKVCGQRIEGIDCGAEVSEWLSLVLGRPNIRLVRQFEPLPSKTKDSPLERSFVSQGQYLLINEASISWLADKIPDASECVRSEILYRFRGNIIIKDCPAFNETNWKSLQIGSYDFDVTGPCTRCQMICIDQNTGLKTVEPLRTLAEELHGKIRFGIYLNRKTWNTGSLKIGDSIYCDVF